MIPWRWRLIESVDVWLTPARRRMIHALAGAAATLLVAAGVASDAVVASWLGIVTATLALGSQVLATIKARRADVRTLYAACAAAIVALRVAGVVEDGLASHWLDVLSSAAAIIGPSIAWARTDTTTPTGEPAAEYQARH